jgi:ferredoxin-NADP reductase
MLVQDLFHYLSARFLFLDEVAKRYEHLHELFVGRSHSNKAIDVEKSASSTVFTIPVLPKKQLVWLITGKGCTSFISLADREAENPRPSFSFQVPPRASGAASLNRHCCGVI